MLSTSLRLPALGLACVGLVALAQPALSGDENGGDYLSHRDTVSLSAGDANAANLAIQAPTPWPWYVNRTTIHGDGNRGVNVIEGYRNGPGGQGPRAIHQSEHQPVGPRPVREFTITRVAT